MEKENFDKKIEDIFNLTDSEEEDSFSSNPYETRQFILDLQGVSKEDPNSSLPNSEQVMKIKKHNKKKSRSPTSVFSESTANSVTPGLNLPQALTPGLTPTVVEEVAKEEFYDAHESYHAIPEKQRSIPVTAAALTPALSAHVQVPKALDSSTVNPIAEDRKAQGSAQSQCLVLEAQKEPLVIMKPVDE